MAQSFVPQSTAPTRTIRADLSSTQSLAGLPYLPGLDGLRAIAVMAVLIYHSWLGWLPGGFLGVEVFFVISGYLITALLLAEWNKLGTVNLRMFWWRRVRRLVPALVGCVLATLIFTVLFLPGEVTHLRADVLAALGYVTNWYLVFSQQSYFEVVGRPSLLQHLWSLAIEGQFYLIWPLLFVLGMRRWPRLMPVAIVLGAIASSVLMTYLYQPTADPSRVYYGTDTRAAGLLYGAAFAFVYAPDRLPHQVGPGVALRLDLLGMGALIVLCGFFLRLNEVEPLLYRGGFVAVAVTTLILIKIAVHPCSFFGWGVLGSKPLRWIGLRSYSIYLWHWPIFMVTRPFLDVPLDGIPLLGVRLLVTLLLADLSYRFIETPFRQGMLGRCWRVFNAAHGLQRRQLMLRGIATAGLFMLCTLWIGIRVVRARPPDTPDYLAALMQPTSARAILPENIPESSVALPSPTLPGRSIQPETGGSQLVAPPVVPNVVILARPVELPPEPEPTPVTAVRITAVGDSVMLGAAGALLQELNNLDLDAAVSRQASIAIDILRWKRDAGQLGDIVVVHIGNNGYFTPGQFDEMMQILADVPRVLFVNVKVPRQWEAPNNGVIVEGVGRYANTELVDWYAVSASRPDFFWYDGYHLRGEGAQVYTDLILAHLADG